MRILPLLFVLLLGAALSAQQSGRHFRRDPRLPHTPAATTAVDASATAERAPLRKLRSGRPWPAHHFGRLPQPHSSPAAGPVDATHNHGASKPRGFWRPRR